MQKRNWIGRRRSATARKASSVARLVHYELGGRATIAGANGTPFLLRHRGPATTGEQAALRLPKPKDPDARGDRSGGITR